ncbi:BlaI/MecI/CopY family transcriptional regulator [Nocardioides cavernae]|uniref:BlaI/MecI/CopY family transcriptional regulator n=1 Tax=Nocardioides cavernae TaxID=1921566 RepID=A0ABR8ND29_9ACTN|nr:BlaI/MecI/CopY family transcriptional regulator [Nocardioides cavernae]MBD3926052.1 BlaI/MecI/CopY family transcriptional regulator [Nocardioides cavernae]MBM7513640.1 putative transcriptional regulator [Nocardioides cavernae]
MSPRSRVGELEQAVLEALWDLDGADAERPGVSGRAVHERLQGRDGRDLAYTTVMTVLDRLARKDVVVRERDGRAFRYAPRLTRAAMTAEVMHEALEGTRGDREQALVSFVGEASAEDLAALRRALDDLA